jgi:lipoprotein-anchoring transpeptidase ErfK/SrfK
MRTLLGIAAIAALFTLGGCTTVKDDQPARPDSTTAAAPAPTTTTPSAPATPATEPDMKIEVDLAARKLYVVKGGQRVETYPVAVGSTEWPTQKGEWKIVQAVFNPEWTPPDESWAEEREPRKPGDPKNPLGVAQLVYDPPRTIHGTNVPSSIGKPVSHGSIRLANDVILKLAREVMEAAGAGKDDAWYAAATKNRTEKQIIDLPNPIPIRVF